MIIRDASIADLPAIVAIYNATIPTRLATADTAPVSVASREPWFHEHTPARRPLWVMDDDGVVSGWFSFQSFYGRPAYHATAELSVYVHAGHRRRGVAWQLLEEAIRCSPSLGLATLVGYIFGHNTPSLRLFERHGFERWGLLPRVAEMDGSERDVVIVGRRVDGTVSTPSGG